MRVTDLKAVTVTTQDLDAAVEAFRQSFGFPVTRSAEREAGQRSVFLGIGAAEIEMKAAPSGGGLDELWLEVDDVEAARAALTAKGVAVEIGSVADGRKIARLGPGSTHGVRITLIGR